MPPVCTSYLTGFILDSSGVFPIRNLTLRGWVNASDNLRPSSITYLPSGMQTQEVLLPQLTWLLNCALTQFTSMTTLTSPNCCGLEHVPEHQVSLSSTENSLKISASSKLPQLFQQGFKRGGIESKRGTNWKEQIWSADYMILTGLFNRIYPRITATITGLKYPSKNESMALSIPKT